LLGIPAAVPKDAAMDFKRFDRRNYPVVSAAEGYAAWAATYEATVPDELDLRVLAGFESVPWAQADVALDLACGTGRIGAWLKARGVGALDGLDLTPAMLERAAARGLYRRLVVGSVERTGLDASAYDLVVMSLVDEHLPQLGPVYAEAARVARPGARLVVVGMHPLFFMTGMPTHFRDADGAEIAIETHVHLVSDHVRAALAAGWRLAEMREEVVDEAWVRVKPKWVDKLGWPVSYGYVWVWDLGL
jgi:SAM-dependent methyltransferase